MLFKNSLNLKLLFMLIIVLAVTFTGLSLTILNRQNSLLAKMSERVDTALTAEDRETRNDFNHLESLVNELLGQMIKNTSASTIMQKNYSELVKYSKAEALSGSL